MKLFFCGDLAQTVDTQKTHLLSKEVREIINNHDFSCVNFEAAMSPKKVKKVSKIGPRIIENERMSELVKNCGFDLLCLANNHIMDCGINGLKMIKRSFDGIAMIGAGETADEAYKPYIFCNTDHTRVGFINVAENGFGSSLYNNEGGYAWFGHGRVEKVIEELRNSCDVVIAVIHAGAELWDIPLPEIRRLYRFFIDMGVDAVIGHHPHTPQGWEQYHSGWIFYSLGNFAFYEGENANNPTRTINVSMIIEEKKIKTCEIVYTEFKDGQVNICTDSDFIAHISKSKLYLENEEMYLSAVKKNIEAVMNNEVINYYSQILGYYYPMSPVGRLKTFIRRNILHEKFNYLWLYHNIMIETHLWIAQRVAKQELLRMNEKE